MFTIPVSLRGFLMRHSETEQWKCHLDVYYTCTCVHVCWVLFHTLRGACMWISTVWDNELIMLYMYFGPRHPHLCAFKNCAARSLFYHSIVRTSGEAWNRGCTSSILVVIPSLLCACIYIHVHVHVHLLQLWDAHMYMVLQKLMY